MKAIRIQFLGVLGILFVSIKLEGASLSRLVGKLSYSNSPMSLLEARSLHATPRLCSENNQESQKEVRRFVESFERLRAEKPFALKKDGTMCTVFDPELSFSTDIKHKITEVVIHSGVKRPIFVGTDIFIQLNYNFPSMNVLDLDEEFFKHSKGPHPDAFLTVAKTGSVVGCNDASIEVLKRASNRCLTSFSNAKEKSFTQLFQEFSQALHPNGYEELDCNHMLAVFYHELGHVYCEHHRKRKGAQKAGLSEEALAEIYRLQECEADAFVLKRGGIVLGKKLEEYFEIRHAKEVNIGIDLTDLLSEHPSSQIRASLLRAHIKELEETPKK